jgi:hypothetical protein
LLWIEHPQEDQAERVHDRDDSQLEGRQGRAVQPQACKLTER